MAKKSFSFKGLETDAEVKFLKREVKRTNTNISTVIKKLIQNAMKGEESKEPKDQIKIIKSELERLKKLSIFIAKNTIYAKHLAMANHIELVKEDMDKINETKKFARELTEEEMKGIQ